MVDELKISGDECSAGSSVDSVGSEVIISEQEFSTRAALISFTTSTFNSD